MKRSTLVEKLSENGCSIVVQNNPLSTSAVIKIGYKLPFGLDPKFDGVAHLVEHLIFGDIIEGYDSSSLSALAKRCGCSINASTSMERIVFSVTIKSLITPAGLIDTNAYSRFDNSEEGIAFAIEFIRGVMKEHIITIDDLNKEKPIVISEYERSKDDRGRRVYCEMTSMLHNKTIIGSDTNTIKSIDIKLVHEFLKSLPDPVIVVEYNDEVEVYNNIEEKINDACKVIPVNNISFHIKSFTSPSLLLEGNSTYDWYKNVTSETVGELNTFGILVPRSSSYEVQSIESNLLQGICLSMFTSVLNKGTLGNFLREELGVIYSIDDYGPINRNKFHSSLIFNACLLNSQTYDLSKYKDRVDFINIIESFLTSVEVPSIEDYIGKLRGTASSYKDVLFEGYSVDYIMTVMLNDGNTTYLNRVADFESSFAYEDFKLMFETMVSSLSFIIL